MRKYFLLLNFWLTAVLSYGQFSMPMNWSGILTDNSGNPFMNTSVSIKFDIVKGSSAQLLQFTELHTVITDQKGFVNAEIGTGNNTFGNLDLIDWSDSELMLRVSVNSGNGFATLGTSFLRAVPYSIKSISSNMLQYDNNLVVITQDGSNEINFITNNTQRGYINNQGEFQIQNLAGTGSKEVIADATGKLQRKPTQTKYLSISGAAFIHKDFNFHPQYGLHQITGAAISFPRLHHNVALPDGAKIVGVKIVYKDNSTSDFQIGLFRHDDVSNAGTGIFNFNTNSQPVNAQWQTHTNNTLNHSVDNAAYSYYLGFYSTSWPSGSDTLSLRRIVITYEE